MTTRDANGWSDRVMATPSELLNQALLDHRQGNLAGAETLYRQILVLQPEHAEAWHLLGAVCVQQKRAEEAIGSLRRALELKPQFAAAHENLGVALALCRRWDEAVASFRSSLALQPTNASAHAHLGHALLQAGQQRQSEVIAGHLVPPSASIPSRDDGLREAVRSFRRALELRPAEARLWDTLGWTLLRLGEKAEAIRSFQEALRIQPQFAQVHSNLGEARRQQGQYADAENCFRHALALDPKNAETHNRLGATLVLAGRLDEAAACLQDALRLDPQNFSALQNSASIAFQRGQPEEARRLLRQVISLNAEYAPAHMALGQACLLLGDFEEGWKEYEWRWFTPEYRLPPLSEPPWRGEPLTRRTILLYAEQGHGDTLHFVRYASLLKARGATVIVACQPALVDLLTRTPGIDRVLAEGTPRPPIDCHAALLSLPGLLGTTLATIPADVPYLFPDPERVLRWRAELSKEPGFKIGIVWQGNPSFTGDAGRSPPLRFFEPLSQVDGVRLYSLQKGHGRDQLRQIASRFPVTDLGERLADDSFADAAAAMSVLDLVVTSCTAPAHLAGGLGVPVWLALHTAADWRWLRHRDTSPWYPSMRLFWQESAGDWAGVFTRMARALTADSGVVGMSKQERR